MELSGLSPDGRLVEIVELRDHPFFVGSQFHPEFKSRPDRAHPLFRDFVGAAWEYYQRSLEPEPIEVEQIYEGVQAPVSGSGQ
jgi:CTP synthase